MPSTIDMRIASEIYKILSTWSEMLGEIKIYDAEGNVTIHEKEARYFFAEGINMMVEFDDNPTSRSMTINISEALDIKNKTLREMIQTFKDAVCTKFGILCNVRRFDGTITPRDFSDGARRRLMDVGEGAAGIVRLARTPEGAEALLRHAAEGGSPRDGFGRVILEIDAEFRATGGGAEERALLEMAGAGYGRARRNASLPL